MGNWSLAILTPGSDSAWATHRRLKVEPRKEEGRSDSAVATVWGRLRRVLIPVRVLLRGGQVLVHVIRRRAGIPGSSSSQESPSPLRTQTRVARRESPDCQGAATRP